MQETLYMYKNKLSLANPSTKAHDENVLKAQLMATFNFFIAKTRTVLEAGLALKTQGSLVKGFTPLRAGVAGFFLSFMFNMPANLKAPFFLSCSAATPIMPS